MPMKQMHSLSTISNMALTTLASFNLGKSALNVHSGHGIFQRFLKIVPIFAIKSRYFFKADFINFGPVCKARKIEIN